MEHPDGQLQTLLLERAEFVRRYVDFKIPPRFKAIICAEDIVQEIWIAAHRQCFSDIREFDHWLLALANSKIVDALRLAGASKRGGKLAPNRRLESVFSVIRPSNPGSTRTPSREVSAREADSEVKRALLEIPDEWRKAIEMRYMDGLSHAEIARSMNKSKSAVNALLFRALRAMQSSIGSATRFFSHVRSRTDKR